MVLGFTRLLWLATLRFGGLFGLVVVGLGAVRLVLRQVRTFCHSQLISSSVGVRSRCKSPLSSLDSLLSAGRVPSCGVPASDWPGCGSLTGDWWMSVGFVVLWLVGVRPKVELAGDDVDELWIAPEHSSTSRDHQQQLSRCHHHHHHHLIKVCWRYGQYIQLLCEQQCTTRTPTRQVSK